jgi:hypothetical protein
MKKVLIINLLSFLVLALTAQEATKKSPTKSPEAAFTQQFGDSEIGVAYARPLARGRKIFGGLVPYDSLWRTGASDCTTLKFKEEVIIGDKKMAVGKYALFTIPKADEWTVILNSDTTLHGTNGYSAQKDVHRFTVKPMKTDRFYETFTIEINDFTAQGSASLNILWENTMVQIPLQSPVFMVAETPTTVKTDAHAGHDMSKMTENTEGSTKTETQPKADAHAGHDRVKMGKNTEGSPRTETAPKMDSHAGMNMPKTIDIKTQFAPVLSAYYALKDALVADNAQLAAEKGKAMKTALRSIETKDWTAKQRNAYDVVAKKLDTDAEHIGDNAGKIDHQREHFMTLSNNLTTLVKTLKINVETAYSQFCPMANDGKGAFWLSKEDKVKNPYYGKKMLTCGSVKETLK